MFWVCPLNPFSIRNHGQLKGELRPKQSDAVTEVLHYTKRIVVCLKLCLVYSWLYTAVLLFLEPCWEYSCPMHLKKNSCECTDDPITLSILIHYLLSNSQQPNILLVASYTLSMGYLWKFTLQSSAAPNTCAVLEYYLHYCVF